tara:strand:- start:127 stop:867 length:741 start_codon:yes stop_codon:yes gene_type:complete
MSTILKNQLKGWYPVLEKTLQSDYFKGVKSAIKKDLKREEVYPKGSDIMKAFSLCPIEKTKIVILGQDPYHDGTATGLAFANPTHCEVISPSLEIIIEEIETNVGLIALPFNQNLEHWAKQGVLLLNTSLTVIHAAPGSHLDLWEQFTERFISDFSQLKPNVIYMLWGAHAQKYEKYIHKNNHILKAEHPIKDYYAIKDKDKKFIGCKHFNIANDMLKEDAIEWRYTKQQLEFLNGDTIKNNFDEI